MQVVVSVKEPHRRPARCFLEQVVKEELELGFAPEPFEEEGALQAQLSATLLSKDFSLAVAVLIKNFSPEYASVAVDSVASLAEGVKGGGGRGQGGRTFEARAHAAAARLEGFAVVFVKELRSRFLRMEIRGGGIRGEEDITAAHGVTGSLFFVQEVGAVFAVGERARGGRDGGGSEAGGDCTACVICACFVCAFFSERVWVQKMRLFIV